VRRCFQVVHGGVPARGHFGSARLAFEILNRIHPAVGAAADQSMNVTVGHLKIQTYRMVATMPFRLNPLGTTAPAVLR